MRRGVLIGVAALLTVAAVVGVLAFFSARDESTIGGEEQAAPGRVDEALTSDRLRRGNVVLYYALPGHRRPLEALAESIAGPPDAALEELGQAVLVERRPRGEKVIANAYRRSLAVESPDDPVLRSFAEYWLGRGAMP